MNGYHYYTRWPPVDPARTRRAGGNVHRTARAYPLARGGGGKALISETRRANRGAER